MTAIEDRPSVSLRTERNAARKYKVDQLRMSPGAEAAAKALRSARRTRLGVTLALVVAGIGAALAVFRCFPGFQPFLSRAAIGFGAIGIIFYFFRFKRGDADETEQDILQFHRNPGYWSFVIIVTTGLSFGLCTMLKPAAPKPELKVAARAPQPKPPAVVANLIELVTPAAAPEFPPLKATGVILNGKKSTVVLNKVTVEVGEAVQGVKVVQILQDRVVVAMGDVTKEVPLNLD